MRAPQQAGFEQSGEYAWENRNGIPDAVSLHVARFPGRGTFVHVYSLVVPLMGESYASPQVYDGMLADIRADAERHLGWLVASARKSGVRVKGFLVEGVPHDRIVRAARLRVRIWSSSEPTAGVCRLLLGSVASRVVTLALCPVLRVREK